MRGSSLAGCEGLVKADPYGSQMAINNSLSRHSTQTSDHSWLVLVSGARNDICIHARKSQNMLAVT